MGESDGLEPSSRVKNCVATDARTRIAAYFARSHAKKLAILGIVVAIMEGCAPDRFGGCQPRLDITIEALLGPLFPRHVFTTYRWLDSRWELKLERGQKGSSGEAPLGRL